MTVTVGTDVYLSVADADVYWSARNDSVWSAATTAAKEAALLQATQYIDAVFHFIGTQNVNNALAWPRYDATVRYGNFAGIVYDTDEIPSQIKDATAELAFRALDGDLIEVKDRDGAVKREKVDVIEIEYHDWAAGGKTYKFAAALLKPLLKTGGASNKNLVRS